MESGNTDRRWGDLYAVLGLLNLLEFTGEFGPWKLIEEIVPHSNFENNFENSMAKLSISLQLWQLWPVAFNNEAYKDS